ncbi:hypothetical protein GXM_04128 [Nostoc sphaeroides CCNUC1]|uniref:Uncharacterized protein n=1 Tax=Nostoc sphaeroides CCNUC1 TaxID=2653204 RepID=A0A5P8W1P5_9NOSO|nr:hypothetical protein GXM_04128 [Nostoc sphaeroides CCNUC1]
MDTDFISKGILPREFVQHPWGGIENFREHPKCVSYIKPTL